MQIMSLELFFETIEIMKRLMFRYACVSGHCVNSAFLLTSQVKVRDIHVRYEDGVTNPETLLAAGITLHSLELKVCRYWYMLGYLWHVYM